MSNLFENIERKRYIEDLKINLISRYHTLSIDQLIKYADILYFESGIMSNTHLTWNRKLITLLESKLYWPVVYRLNQAVFDFDFFKQFEDKIEFETIHYYNRIAWSDELLANYGSKFNWKSDLISNKSICTIENITRFKESLDWSRASRDISIVENEDIIDMFIDNWDWNKLSSNPNLPLNEKFIQKYKNRLNFDILSSNPKAVELIFKYPGSKKWNWENVIFNRGIKYNKDNFEFIFKNYASFKRNKDVSIVLSEKNLLQKFVKIVFLKYIGDKSFFLEDKILSASGFNILEYANNIAFPLDFIEKYKSFLNFSNSKFLTSNKSTITHDFISNNLNLFDLSNSGLYHLPINNKLITKIKGEINWLALSSCENLDWTWEYIESNFEYLNWYNLSRNKGIYDKLIKQTDIITFLDYELQYQ